MPKAVWAGKVDRQRRHLCAGHSFCAASSGQALFGDAVLHPRRLHFGLRGIQNEVGFALFHHSLRYLRNDDLFYQLLGSRCSSEVMLRRGGGGATCQGTGQRGRR